MEQSTTVAESAADGVDTGGAALVELERSLENACETLAAIAGGVLDFTYDGQELLFTKVNEFVRDLAHLDAKAQAVNAEVPVEVLEAIDVGRNPEHCTYQMLESCAEASSAAQGKLEIMQEFHAELDKALDQAGLPRPTADEIAAAVAPREALPAQAETTSGPAL